MSIQSGTTNRHDVVNSNLPPGPVQEKLHDVLSRRIEEGMTHVILRMDQFPQEVPLRDELLLLPYESNLRSNRLVQWRHGVIISQLKLPGPEFCLCHNEELAASLAKLFCSSRLCLRCCSCFCLRLCFRLCLGFGICFGFCISLARLGLNHRGLRFRRRRYKKHRFSIEGCLFVSYPPSTLPPCYVLEHAPWERPHVEACIAIGRLCLRIPRCSSHSFFIPCCQLSRELDASRSGHLLQFLSLRWTGRRHWFPRLVQAVHLWRWWRLLRLVFLRSHVPDQLPKQETSWPTRP
mmetsp:Transcript_46267/g.107604  ORF Transcript_46267/g.107604 Transcript_46267/m.107604 type:complete len:292 (-) Transcript_46267:4-879(-)